MEKDICALCGDRGYFFAETLRGERIEVECYCDIAQIREQEVVFERS